jgi:hypothetical protein
MIELYQELVPFTNDKTQNAASTNSTYSNPILMPLSLDVTSSYNIVETVIYIRNSDKDKYYDNVFISLMAPKSCMTDPVLQTDAFAIGSIVYDHNAQEVIVSDTNSVRFKVDVEYCAETVPSNLTPEIDITSWDDGTAVSNALPISGITNYTIQSQLPVKDVRFSYGYEELSELVWSSKSHSLMLPSIGNQSLPDNSYIPIRMRIYLNNTYGDLLTLRDYSINVSYSSEGTII